jgi:hypothetical protein
LLTARLMEGSAAAATPGNATLRDCQLEAGETKLPLAQLSCQPTLSCEGSSCRIAPGSECAIAGSAVLIGGETMTAELEVVMDRAVRGEKLLRVPS